MGFILLFAIIFILISLFKSNNKEDKGLLIAILISPLLLFSVFIMLMFFAY